MKNILLLRTFKALKVKEVWKYRSLMAKNMRKKINRAEPS